MSKKTKKQPDNEKELAILKLMQDIHCLDDLRKWTDGINFFHVLKIARTEIRHSNMLAWLLDPNENHGLGTSFLQAFITDLSKSHSYESAVDESVYDAILTPKAAIALLSADLTDTRIYREWNHIDVLIKLPKDYIVAIENKVDATESTKNGKSQLTVYREVLEKNYANKEKTIKLFLTPNGDPPSQENEDWMVYTYSDIMPILESVYRQHCNNLSVEAQVLIKNYLDVLNNEIMDDLELKNLCNEIYKKHKLAFDTIFEYKESVTSMAADICFRRITELKNSKYPEIELISQKSGVNIHFTTPGSKNLHKQLKAVTEVYYQFEFKPSKDDGVNASFSLVLHNRNKKYVEDDARVIEQYADKNQCIDGKNWEWKGIWGVKKGFEEIDDSAIGDWVANSYSDARKYELSKMLFQPNQEAVR